MAVTALSGQRWQGSSVGIPNSFTPEGTFDIEYLVVAGGGGGASAIGANNEGHSSGAGGAGGYLANGTKDHEVTAQTYNITVGLGGAGGSGDESEAGTNGGNSIFDTETAIGGGGGGNSSGSPSAGATGKVGGSGGGGAAYESQAGGAGTSGQGYAGGAGIYGPNYGGGGGGGSASVGADADSSTGGNGGTGTSNDIQDDSSVIYAAGGGGGGSNPHDGGIGGSSSVGGDGWTPSSVATDGAVRTGSGGGGTVYGDAGSGSAGIVIIRFTTSGNSFSQVGGAETTVGSDTVITFTTAGTQDDKTTVTDVPAGSQFEETDTRKFYQMKDTSDAYTNVDDLKVYFQWENTSGNITNLAEDKGSSSSLGTGADVVSGTFTDYEQTGIIEKCVGFDGYDDYGALGTSLSQFNFFHGTGDWTVNFWIRLSSYVNEARYFDNLSGTEESGITLRNGGSTTTLGIAVCNDSGDFMANADFSLDEALSTGEWHMITFTCDYSDASDCYECFVDGQPQDTVARSYAGSSSDSDASLKTMSRDSGSNNFQDGKQDETSIWQRVLSDADILTLYNSGDGMVIDSPEWVERGTAI